MRSSATRADNTAAGPPASRIRNGQTTASSFRNGHVRRVNVSKATRVSARNRATKKHGTTAPKSRVSRTQKVADAYAELPSRRAGRQRKCVNPFGRPNARHGISKFAAAYDRRQIPFRIRHSGSGKNSLQWDVNPEDMATYDPLLVYVADGLCESRHPFMFLARTAFQQMLEVKSGPEKATACLQGVVEALRRGLMVKDEDVTMAVLRAVQQLSAAVREQLTPYYKFLVTQVNKRGLNKKIVYIVDTTLQTLERNGGPHAFKQIRSKLPAYQSFLGK